MRPTSQEMQSFLWRSFSLEYFSGRCSRTITLFTTCKRT